MTITVGITEFRNNIFKYVDMVWAGDVVEVERENETYKVIKLTKRKSKSEQLYDLLLKVGGKCPDWKYDKNEYRNIKEEQKYLEKLGS